MGKPFSSVLISLHRSPFRTCQNSNANVRNCTGGTKVGVCVDEISPFNASKETVLCVDQSFKEIAQEICKITRTKPRWEQTLVSQYPSLKLSDPQFFHEFLKQQNNVLLSLRFFFWLQSQHEFSPSQSSCTMLFDDLVDAKACKAAISFLDNTGFSPAPLSLEKYFRCLCEDGLFEEALSVLSKLKAIGHSPSVETWNVALLHCVRNQRTDIVWKLYPEIENSGTVDNSMDVETAGYLIEAFCHDKEVCKGFELFRQISEVGMLPANAVLNRLISGLCAQEEYSRVSHVLHTMIAMKQNPDIRTYHEIVNGLVKKRRLLEGLRVFNDLKARGYFPHTAMYTTLISGLCDAGWLAEAKILWFEMIRRGITPNHYTYNALLHGFFKAGNFKEGWKVYQEMSLRGYGESTVSYNAMISGLCLHGRTDEALVLFEAMASKGVAREVLTYNYLILGFCSEGMLVEGAGVLSALLASGLKPSAFSFSPLIEKLCEVGCIQEAKKFWKDMLACGLEPMARTYENFIISLCEQGCVGESIEWLVEMTKKKFKPQKQIFQRLIECLLVTERLDDTFVVLEFMVRAGCVLDENICHFLVDKLCDMNSTHVVECLDKVL